MARTPATECESSDQAQSASWRGDHEVAVGRFGPRLPHPYSAEPCPYGPLPLLRLWVVE